MLKRHTRTYSIYYISDSGALKIALFEMWLYKVLPILLLQANFCRSITQCCPEHTEWEGSLNCSDGSPVRLTCQTGMYKLDPKEDPSTDSFRIVEEELQIAENIGRTAQDRFCLTEEKGSPIALICFEDPPSPWRNILFGTLATLSAVFLYATLFVYGTLPELRDLQGKILMSAMSSLLVAYILLAVVQLHPKFLLDHDTVCTGLAFALYYCFMAAFFWMNLVAFDVWRSAWFIRTVIREEVLYCILSLIGWGGPCIFMITAIMGHHGIGNILNPGFGIYSCWFAGPHETWVYMYGPVACLMTLNVLYFTLTCYELWHKYRGLSGTKLKVLRFKCLLYLKLLLVMGMTWIFEVISFATGSSWENYWILTDALNSLQGLIIFILLVATRKRVRKLLAKRRPCGINFPKSWAAGEDEECEIVLADEEVELSQAN